jgi:hypothetical protein
MKRNWVYLFLVTPCLLPASCAIAQTANCKTDRAQFVTRNDASIRDDSANEYRKHFDQIAGSLSQLFAEVTIKKLNAGAKASELTGYLQCVTRGNDITPDIREWLTRVSNAPAVLIPQTASPPQAIVATYPIVGHSTDEEWAIAPSRPVVQCFAKNATGWSLVGELGGDYSSHTFSIYLLTSPVPGQSWSLLAGRAIGDTGGRVLLEVVVCDGKTFTKKWTRPDIQWGEVEVDGNLVLLTYVKIFVNGTRTFSEGDPIRYSEVLHVTPNGLE